MARNEKHTPGSRRVRAGLAGIAVAAGLSAMATTADAADLSRMLGRWALGSESCSAAKQWDRFTIKRDGLQFYESSCEIFSTRPAGIGDAVVARVACQGEGEHWEGELFLARIEENKLMAYYSSGFGWIAVHCGR